MRNERIFVLGAATFLVGSWGLAACAVVGALSGTANDCTQAEAQLKTLQSALTVAEAGAAAMLPGASAAVAVIQNDVASVQALVDKDCAATTTALATLPPRLAAQPRQGITLEQAKILAAKDKALAQTVAK